MVVSPTIQFFSALADLIVKWTLEHRSTAPGIERRRRLPAERPLHRRRAAVRHVVLRARCSGTASCSAGSSTRCTSATSAASTQAAGRFNARDFFDESVTDAADQARRAGHRSAGTSPRPSSRHSREPDSDPAERQERARRPRARSASRCSRCSTSSGPAVVKGVMRRTIADCSRVVSERLARIPDGTWSERLYVTGLMPGEGTTHQEVLTLTKRGDQVFCTQRGNLAAGRRRATPRTASCARASSAALDTALAWDQLGCAAGRREPRRLRPRAGHAQRRALAGGGVGAPEHLHHARSRGAVTSKMLLGAPGGPARARLRRRRPVPAARRHRPRARRAHAARGDPGQRRAGAPRRLPRRLPVRDGIDSGGSWWMVGSSAGNVEEGEEAGIASCSSAPRTPTAAPRGCGAAATASPAAGRRTRSRWPWPPMIWADPSANPVALAGRRLPRPRRQLPAPRQRRGRQAPRGGGLPAAGRRSRSTPAR